MLIEAVKEFLPLEGQFVGDGAGGDVNVQDILAQDTNSHALLVVGRQNLLP
jgi:hypothetical protein